jgi:DNA-binding PadR family transcriptional regulator
MSPTPPKDPEALLPLSNPVLHILLSLAERDLHGYGLLGDIRGRTAGDVDLSTSTLYGAIKRMMRDGLVADSGLQTDPQDDERRRYYCITNFGRAVLQREAARIERLARMVKGKQFHTGTP